MSDERAKCSKCGVEYGVGDSPWCRDRHARVTPTNAFHAGFDWGLGAEVYSLGERKALMRKHGLDYRDHPSPGEMSVKFDKINEKHRRSPAHA